jgi:hypothetical protein
MRNVIPGTQSVKPERGGEPSDGTTSARCVEEAEETVKELRSVSARAVQAAARLAAVLR